MLGAIYFVLHGMSLWPIISFLGRLSIYCQARKILVVPFPNSLNLQGLALQAIIFRLISVVWIWCLPFPQEHTKAHMDWNTFTVWHGSSMGRIIADSFISAFGHATLFVLAFCRASSDKLAMQRGCETEPLLGSLKFFNTCSNFILKIP